MTILLELIETNSLVPRVLSDIGAQIRQEGIRKDADRWERSMTCYRYEDGKRRSS